MKPSPLLNKPINTLPSPWPIALAGMVSLGVAMGIGRFAFTPILPMMLNDGVVDLPGASWLASANYLGYLLGAVLCTLQPWIWARLRWLPLLAYSTLMRAGLLLTVVLTLAMAWQVPAAWPALRFAAGVTSAIVFVYTSGWCLSQLARLGVPGMGAIIYAGPGIGIVLSGLFASAMVALHWTAATAWLIFGVLAFALSATAWRVLKKGGSGSAERLIPLVKPVAGARAAGQQHHGPAEMAVFTFAYGLAGFGYIITATFLPVIAREALPGSAWLDMFWPIFGIGTTAGALLVMRLRPAKDFRSLLAICFLLQALGIATSLWSPSLVGFAVGSLLLGLPFTAITFFAMQEVRRLRPATAASFIGLLSATYGVGQILGPPLVALLLSRTATAGEGFSLSLEIATGALLLGAGLFGLIAKLYPVLPGKAGETVAAAAEN